MMNILTHKKIIDESYQYIHSSIEPRICLPYMNEFFSTDERKRILEFKTREEKAKEFISILRNKVESNPMVLPMFIESLRYDRLDELTKHLEEQLKLIPKCNEDHVDVTTLWDDYWMKDETRKDLIIDDTVIYTIQSHYSNEGLRKWFFLQEYIFLEIPNIRPLLLQLTDFITPAQQEYLNEMKVYKRVENFFNILLNSLDINTYASLLLGLLFAKDPYENNTYR